MNITPFAQFAALCGFVALMSTPVSAQQKPAPVKFPAEVVDVRFAATKLGNTVQHPMNRVEVVVSAIANAKFQEDPKAIVPNKDWVDKIKVTVTVAYELSAVKKSAAASPADTLAFYRASATIMTVEKLSRSSLFFYLPGEIVKRDRLKVEPYAYAVELEVDGKKLENPKLSKVLQGGDAYKNFLTMADRGVIDNAGILRPQYQVPYEQVHSLSPTLIREDTTR